MRAFEIASARVFLVEAPLRRPFVTALGRRDRTVNAALELRLRGGARGYGEASTSLAQRHLTPAALRRALESLARGAAGRDARGWRRLAGEAWRAKGALSPAASAFESAALTALAAQAGTTLAAWLGGARESAETDLTISAEEDPRLATAAAVEAAAAGFRVLKVKLAGAEAADLARLRAVRRAAPRARLLLDGNQAFSPRAALRLVERALSERMPVELLEQPTPKARLAELAAVARRCPVPVAADESVATPEDAARAVDAGVTAINVKLAKSGLSRALEIAAIARAARLPLMIGCMAETARGLAASVHLALGTGFFRWHDLDSDALLAEPASARAKAGWTRRGPVVSL